jgi:ABC-type multidrug transport system fused ATPase/permease subunit
MIIIDIGIISVQICYILLFRGSMKGEVCNCKEKCIFTSEWRIRVGKSKISSLFRLIKEAKHYHILMAAMLVMIMKAILRQAVTYFLGSLVDTALNQDIKLAINLFIYLIAGILILLILELINNGLFGSFANYSMYQIRRRTFMAMEALPFSTLSGYSTGDLISRMNNDLGFVERFYRSILQNTGFNILIGLAAAAYGMIINYKAMILLIIICTAVSIINYRMSRPISRKQGELQQIAGEVSSSLQDSMNGHIEIKSFELYDTFLNRFQRLISISVKKFFAMTGLECLWGAIEITASIGVQIGAVFICLYYVLRNEMTIGDMIIFQQLQEMVRNIFQVNYIDIGKAAVASDKILELWREEPEKLGGRQVCEDLNAPIISLKEVSYSYQEPNGTDKHNVLDMISFHINRKEKVAIVGPSGCGKTTLVKLICGLQKPDSGELYYKGSFYDSWDLRVLRQGISLVDQNAHIFPVSIFDNIACGVYGQTKRGEGKDQELNKIVQEAAEKACLKEYINSLEKGFDANVGEFGSKLSGGQRQRIALARAFVKNSELLILDEPTSALDALTEQEIQNSVDALVKDRAVIIVAHRLSTVKNADRILVMNHGRIVEEGTHDNLLHKKGLYYQLYQQQCCREEG